MVALSPFLFVFVPRSFVLVYTPVAPACLQPPPTLLVIWTNYRQTRTCPTLTISDPCFVLLGALYISRRELPDFWISWGYSFFGSVLPRQKLSDTGVSALSGTNEDGIADVSPIFTTFVASSRCLRTLCAMAGAIGEVSPEASAPLLGQHMANEGYGATTKGGVVVSAENEVSDIEGESSSVRDSASTTSTTSTTAEVQDGLRRMEAVARTWSEWGLMVAYMSIFLMAFTTSLEGQVTYPLAAFAVSSFNNHSLLSTVYVVQNVVNGAFCLLCQGRSRLLVWTLFG